MPASLIDTIVAAYARSDLDADAKRTQVYELKTTALLDVITPMVGQTVEYAGFTFCINRAEATDTYRLMLDVTFTRPGAEPVTHQITITNPPVAPREKTGNEQADLRTAVCEMLEGYV